VESFSNDGAEQEVAKPEVEQRCEFSSKKGNHELNLQSRKGLNRKRNNKRSVESMKWTHEGSLRAQNKTVK
jgi:hypothetical protein